MSNVDFGGLARRAAAAHKALCKPLVVARGDVGLVEALLADDRLAMAATAFAEVLGEVLGEAGKSRRHHRAREVVDLAAAGRVRRALVRMFTSPWYGEHAGVTVADLRNVADAMLSAAELLAEHGQPAKAASKPRGSKQNLAAALGRLRKEGVEFPTQKQLAAAAGVSVRTVRDSATWSVLQRERETRRIDRQSDRQSRVPVRSDF